MKNKRKIIPGEIPTSELHQCLLGSISPRPIAFVSTVDEDGNYNLAPYSFFNAFSSNPPIVVFSSNRRVSNNTTKDTLHNIQVNKSCVISVVNYDIMRQMSLASVEFPSGVSEFEMTGLTPRPSEMVDAPGVEESPVNMECTVRDIVTLGVHGGAGHLIICDVKLIHIAEEVFEDGKINPHKMDLVGRMGRNFYVRASGDAILSLYQDINASPIGYNALPLHVRQSKVLTANDIGALASVEGLPTDEEISKAAQLYDLTNETKESLSAKLIKEGKEKDALALLLSMV